MGELPQTGWPPRAGEVIVPFEEVLLLATDGGNSACLD